MPLYHWLHLFLDCQGKLVHRQFTKVTHTSLKTITCMRTIFKVLPVGSRSCVCVPTQTIKVHAPLAQWQSFKQLTTKTNSLQNECSGDTECPALRGYSFEGRCRYVQKEIVPHVNACSYKNNITMFVLKLSNIFNFAHNFFFFFSSGRATCIWTTAQQGQCPTRIMATQECYSPR